MKIIEIITLFLSGLVIDFFYVYYCNKLVNNEMNYKDKSNWIIIIIMTIIGMILNDSIPRLYKLIISIFFLYGVVFYISKRKLKESILIFLSLQITIILSEVICFGIISPFIKDDRSFIIAAISNIIVSIVGYFIMKSKLLSKVYNLGIKTIKKLNKKETIISVLMILFVLLVTTVESYMKLPIIIILITNTIISIIFISIMIKFTLVKSKYNEINSKYQTSITSLKEYENMIDKYRIYNHENKNELLTIRNMINDKKAIKYIDKLVDTKIKENEKIMKNIYRIPEGGLRATIYSKLCTIDEKKIDYSINIAKNVKPTYLIDIEDNVIVGVCRILGVIIDNAIEAVEQLKEKIIEIEIYIIENELYIDVTNNYEGNLDLSKISNPGYTTKGKGHGYGLKLVEQIINNNKGILDNYKSINGSKFTQTIKIKCSI